jgi:hypothetical protein
MSFDVLGIKEEHGDDSLRGSGQPDAVVVISGAFIDSLVLKVPVKITF